MFLYHFRFSEENLHWFTYKLFQFYSLSLGRRKLIIKFSSAPAWILSPASKKFVFRRVHCFLQKIEQAPNSESLRSFGWIFCFDFALCSNRSRLRWFTCVVSRPLLFHDSPKRGYSIEQPRGIWFRIRFPVRFLHFLFTVFSQSCDDFLHLHYTWFKIRPEVENNRNRSCKRADLWLHF